MTRAQEKTAIGKFLKECSKFDKRILNVPNNKVHVNRIDFNNVGLLLDYRGHTYQSNYNIKDVIY